MSNIDAWCTVTNQTALWTTAERVAFNAALRKASRPDGGEIDLTSLLETAPGFENGPVTDGSVWPPGYVSGGDGTHPNSAAMLAGQPLVAVALAVLR